MRFVAVASALAAVIGSAVQTPGIAYAAPAPINLQVAAGSISMTSPTYIHKLAPPTPAAEMVEASRFRIRNVKIDASGNAAEVQGGVPYRISFDLLHDCSMCGNAVNQVIIGLAGEDRAQASVWNGKQRSGGGAKVVNAGTSVQAVAEDNPGPAAWVNVWCDLVAPNKPGVYSIRARYAQAYQGRLMTAEGHKISQPEYQDALGWWKIDRPDGPGPQAAIGTIIVRP
jgi:hypothetical protein